MTEQTINVLGKDVRMRYCAATETGFEQITGKSINDLRFDSLNDLLSLAMAGIVAAYSRDKEDMPIDSNDLLYDAKPNDIVTIIKAVIDLRAEWYGLPAVVKQAIKDDTENLEEGEGEKNS